MRALLRGHRAVDAEDEASLIAAMNLATQGGTEEVAAGIERRMASARAGGARDDAESGLAEKAAALGIRRVERK